MFVSKNVNKCRKLSIKTILIEMQLVILKLKRSSYHKKCSVIRIIDIFRRHIIQGEDQDS